MSTSERILTLCLVIGILVVQGCWRTEVDHWANGKIKSEFSYLGKRLDGTSTWWYESGIRQMEVNYQKDKIDGTSTRWHFNGNVESRSTYSNGMKNGLTQTWDTDGNRVSEENFRNDTLHGAYTVWFPNGQFKIKGFFHCGLFDSTWTYYNEMGIRIGEGVFARGSGTLKGFDVTGRLQYESNYSGNKKHGAEVWYDSSGEIVKRAIYENGQYVEEKDIK
jgi:antitoxin component YwqK of YwqJK toxin-antitoxin module